MPNDPNAIIPPAAAANIPPAAGANIPPAAAVVDPLAAAAGDPPAAAANGGIMSSTPANSWAILLLFLWLTGCSVGILIYMGSNWDVIPNLTQTPEKFSEHSAFFIIALLGALGGCLHGIQSLVIYVGGRGLLRSWILYYVALPVKGAVLGIIVVLVLRWGVISQSGNAAPGNLNWIGLYAISVLSGMFSSQAIEKLADIFNNVMKPVESVDKREKPTATNS